MATRRRTSASKTAKSATKSIKESTISVKKVTTPPVNRVNKVTQPKVKKVIDPTDTAPVIINLPEGTNLKKVVRTPAESPQNKDLDLQKLFKDYPRDGFALALLPLLLLEALTKEGLKLAGVSV
tara:strand:- start:102 stop:473 length:372 start_codon:yes stop_codon:yes gene_type:complete